MAETTVPRGSRVRLGVVDGDLHVGNHVQIEVDGTLIVRGKAYFEGSADVRGAMECQAFEGRAGPSTSPQASR